MFHGTPRLSRRRLLQFAGIVFILGSTWPLGRASATLTVNPDAEEKARLPGITQKPPQRPEKPITSFARERVPKPPLSFPESNGVIYALMDNNDLLWYRHDGRDDGSFRWAASSGSKVGTGWSFKHVFAAEGGVIYAVTATNDLLIAPALDSENHRGHVRPQARLGGLLSYYYRNAAWRDFFTGRRLT